MTDIEPLRTQLEPFMENQRATLAELICRHTDGNGSFASAIPALFLSRQEQCSQSFPALMRPALCILANGSKRIRLGDEDYVYDPLNYMVVSVAMPLSGAILEATPDNPCLSLRLDIEPAEINALIAAAGPMGVPARPTERGLYVEQLDAPLLDAVLRLVRLLDDPKDIAMLAPLIRREILYRLLRSPQGHRLYEIAIGNSQMHRVTQAIDWLNNHYDHPLRIEDLAREVNLSVSTLHHRFKAMTSMSPLQYQKQLRLQEARRLMLSDGLDACTAGYRVGYESASQFSREYSRLFGTPPARDLQRLRMTV